jgi:hypothetical protein
VPEEVLMDNPRALVVRHDAVSRSVQFNDKRRVREALGVPSSRLRAVSGAHEGQDGERRGLREEERDRRALLHELGGIRGGRSGSARWRTCVSTEPPRRRRSPASSATRRTG